MTALAILCALFAGVALRSYLRTVKLVARLRRARSRIAGLRIQLDNSKLRYVDTTARSLKRRNALIRVARHCRSLRDDLDIADVVGAELAIGIHEQATRYDTAILALSRRVAELTLVSCTDLTEFFDGELPADRADAFRGHLAGCADCERRLEGKMQLHAVTSLAGKPS